MATKVRKEAKETLKVCFFCGKDCGLSRCEHCKKWICKKHSNQKNCKNCYKKYKWQGGTWFLSYICEIGIIENDDSVFANSVTGTLKQDWCNIPKGYQIYAVMSPPNVLELFWASKEEVKEIEDETEDSWFIHEKVARKIVYVNLSFSQHE